MHNLKLFERMFFYDDAFNKQGQLGQQELDKDDGNGLQAEA